MQEKSKIIRLISSTLSWFVIFITIMFAIYSNDSLKNVAAVDFNSHMIFWGTSDVFKSIGISFVAFCVFEAIHTIVLYVRSEKEVDDYNENITAIITGLIGSLDFIFILFISLSNILLMNGVSINMLYVVYFLIVAFLVCLSFLIATLYLGKNRDRGGKYVEKKTHVKNEITVNI